ncbi:enoyl-CoA hydratase-related protein [Ruegeria arenilitoris]|uniref:enoyl-CoA hydratase-related protein n=1 Tax=Ruegeria arenilitoris TaxID=1173585 RepID=UPI0014817DBC|nr:enoyl-CoA hydratase-related protein [Ruegeria arenilitoris]
MTDNIIINTQDRVTTVTISREEKKNAITFAMYTAMAEAIEDYGRTDEARALVITGTGDMFTAGNDLQDFMGGGVPLGSGENPIVRFLNAIRDCPKPLIAAVNGAAIGIGLTMLLHCDLVYAGESATFSAPFAQLGLVPEAGSSMLLPASVGMAVANDVLLAGRVLTATEALNHGLVARVFADNDLAANAQQIAAQIAGSSPAALKKSKALIRRQRDEIAGHMSAEIQVFAEQLQSADFAESVAAKLQKRTPSYG